MTPVKTKSGFSNIQSFKRDQQIKSKFKGLWIQSTNEPVDHINLLLSMDLVHEINVRYLQCHYPSFLLWSTIWQNQWLEIFDWVALDHPLRLLVLLNHDQVGWSRGSMIIFIRFEEGINDKWWTNLAWSSSCSIFLDGMVLVKSMTGLSLSVTFAYWVDLWSVKGKRIEIYPPSYDPRPAHPQSAQSLIIIWWSFIHLIIMNYAAMIGCRLYIYLRYAMISLNWSSIFLKTIDPGSHTFEDCFLSLNGRIDLLLYQIDVGRNLWFQCR